MARWILLYGSLLAAVAFVLNWLDFRHALRSISTELYVLCLAIIFTLIGAWAGARLTARPSLEPFQPNEKAMRYLGISARESRVLELLAEGHSNKEIARLLGISPNTVKTHVARLFEKLGASRRTEAIRRARELGLIA